MSPRILLLAALLTAACASPSPDPQSHLEVAVLSSPGPDLVSGGDALVEVRGATGPVELLVNGRVVTTLRYDTSRGSLAGLVSGFDLGPNEIVARTDESSARLIVVNHSSDGPILSGPHITPYECKTVQAGLGPAIDAACNAETRIERFYRSTDGKFKPLAAGPLPADLASTTTIDGTKAPYIVRVESGTLNRTIYRIAVLDSPEEAPPTTWRPNASWNGRLAVHFDGGLAGRYEQGFNLINNVLNDLYLSRGFAIMNASGLANGLVSNAIIQGETLMMLKEHFIENYGLPRWTVGTGGSGGAIQQIHITALYPGLLDGIQAEVGFADSQVATHVLDCDLLENYWSKAPAGTWTDEMKAAVAGYGSAETCRVWKLIMPGLKINNKNACGLSDRALAYDPKTNPGGARCGIYPWFVNQLGRDEETGFPLSPLDNVGLQYGLRAFNEGKISAEAFLDLNAHIGGYTPDMDYAPARTAAKPEAMRRLYASGLVNSGAGGLGYSAILQYRNYQDHLGDFHDRQRDFEIRYRLIRANGDADNQVIWVAPGSTGNFQPNPMPLQTPVLDTMTKWLDAIASDPAPLDHAKVVRLRPVEAVDTYFDEGGARHAAEATMDPDTEFNRKYPVFFNPRIAAGGPLTNDILKCALKPVDESDYASPLTQHQILRLRAIFPDGVCDFSKPGIGQVDQSGVYVRY